MCGCRFRTLSQDFRIFFTIFDNFEMGPFSDEGHLRFWLARSAQRLHLAFRPAEGPPERGGRALGCACGRGRRPPREGKFWLFGALSTPNLY